jgi:hypothetical protein
MLNCTKRKWLRAGPRRLYGRKGQREKQRVLNQPAGRLSRAVVWELLWFSQTLQNPCRSRCRRLSMCEIGTATHSYLVSTATPWEACSAAASGQDTYSIDGVCSFETCLLSTTHACKFSQVNDRHKRNPADAWHCRTCPLISARAHHQQRYPTVVQVRAAGPVQRLAGLVAAASPAAAAPLPACDLYTQSTKASWGAIPNLPAGGCSLAAGACALVVAGSAHMAAALAHAQDSWASRCSTGGASKLCSSVGCIPQKHCSAAAAS